MHNLFELLICGIVRNVNVTFSTDNEFDKNLKNVCEERLWPLLSKSKEGYIDGMASGYGVFRVNYDNDCRESNKQYDGDEMNNNWKQLTTPQRREWKRKALDSRYDYYINWMRLNLDQDKLKKYVSDNSIFDSIVRTEIFAWERKVLDENNRIFQPIDEDCEECSSFTTESTSLDYED